MTRDVLAARGARAPRPRGDARCPSSSCGLFDDIAVVPLEGLQPRRSLYALTPADGARDSARAFLDALRP